MLAPVPRQAADHEVQGDLTYRRRINPSLSVPTPPPRPGRKRPSPSARPPACPPGAGPGAQSFRARQGHLPTTHISTTPPRLRAHGSSVGRPPEPHCCCDSCHRRVTWNGVNTLHSSPSVGNPGRDSRTKIEVSGRGDRVHPGGPRRSPGPAFSLLPLHATRAPQPETSELRLRSLGSHQSETPFPQRCLAFEGFQRGGVTPGARPGRPSPQAEDPLTGRGAPGGASGRPDTRATKNHHRGSENDLLRTAHVGLGLPANARLN